MVSASVLMVLVGMIVLVSVVCTALERANVWVQTDTAFSASAKQEGKGWAASSLTATTTAAGMACAMRIIVSVKAVGLAPDAV